MEPSSRSLSIDLAHLVKQRVPVDRMALLERNSLDGGEWRPVYIDLEEEAPAEGAARARNRKIYTILATYSLTSLTTV
jgi:hypothetical protein